jgi:hypothetical protein
MLLLYMVLYVNWKKRKDTRPKKKRIQNAFSKCLQADRSIDNTIRTKDRVNRIKDIIVKNPILVLDRNTMHRLSILFNDNKICGLHVPLIDGDNVDDAHISKFNVVKCDDDTMYHTLTRKKDTVAILNTNGSIYET